MVQDTPSRKLEQYIVRFPDGMRDKLKDEAAQNNRSLNAEIIHRLNDSIRMQGGLFGLRDETATVDVSALPPEGRRQVRAIVEALAKLERMNKLL